MTNFNIQIISDTVCPWCYVGYRRLTHAITAHRTTHPTDTFTLNWRAFYLNPSAPGYPGVDKQEAYSEKFGPERAIAIFTRLAAAGEAEGIKFKFGGKTGSTRDSHRVLWFAGQQEKEKEKEKEKETGNEMSMSDSGEVGGVQTRVVENLFRAYFEEEMNITDRNVLKDAAVRAGLDSGEMEKVLGSDVGGNEVDAEVQNASRKLVTGVPYFMVQGKYTIQGADEPETFLEIFERVKRDE